MKQPHLILSILLILFVALTLAAPTKKSDVIETQCFNDIIDNQSLSPQDKLLKMYQCGYNTGYQDSYNHFMDDDIYILKQKFKHKQRKNKKQ